MDKNTHVNVYLDLSNAFDTINCIIQYDILVSGTPFKLIHNYLTNKRQSV